MKKKYIYGIIIVVVILIALWQFFGSRGERSRIYFKSTTIVEGNVSNYVTATGTIEPVIKVEVGTQVSGIVEKLYVDYNSIVTKGQVIAELDKTNLLTELESQKSSLEKAQSDYDYQLANYNRYKTLHEKGLVSDNDYEIAYDSYVSSKTSLEMAKQNLSKAQTNLSYATITSPIDGVVLSKSVEEGQTVASSFSTPTLFYIANDLTQMRVIADVDEADIGQVLEGQRVEFTVDAYVGETFNGTVTQVRQNATTTNNVVTYEVVIDAPNEDLKLKPGLTANITIYTEESNGVLTVEPKALKFSPADYIGSSGYSVEQGSEQYVGKTSAKGEGVLWKLENKIFTAVPVTTGATSKLATEITSGIAKGTKVVLEATALSGSEITAAESDENSPFMPQRPGGNKKK